MCIDFIDLNRAYPRDHYPLPIIDRLVDSTIGHAVCSFVDIILGYHQIKLDLDDEEKKAFITDSRVCCYKVMPFRLKNIRVTYQCLVTKCLRD